MQELDSDDCTKLGNHYETVSTTDNIDSVRTHAQISSIFKNVLDSCKFGVRKYQICLGERERKKQREQYAYHIDKLKRLTNKCILYHENTKRME
jgi:hypothetical protein